ncbi:MAG: hypothetical protein ACJAYC_000604 [Halieaceae bacterium]|jgi:hypothetical protein
MDRSGYHHETKVNVNSYFKKRLPIKSNVDGSLCQCFSWPTLYEPKTILNKLIRILTPDGLIMSQVPMPYWIYDAPYAFFRFTPPSLKRLLSKVAFVDLGIEPLCGFFSMWLLKFNYYSERFSRSPMRLNLAIKALLLQFLCLNQKATQ